jgi:hypothetical protein
VRADGLQVLIVDHHTPGHPHTVHWGAGRRTAGTAGA